MKKYWILKGIKIAVAVVAFGFLFTYVVMSLWNWLVPELFHGPVLNFWQALGVLVLSKILFGGFKKGGGCCHKGACGHKGGMHWRQRLEDKLSHMTPEEKEKFKQKFGNKCRSWMGDSNKEETSKE